MTSDPCEVMSAVVIQEASRLQAETDGELLLEAYAIAESELQRSRMRERFEAARGTVIRIHLPGVVHEGVLTDVGDALVTLVSDKTCEAIAISSITTVDRLPLALRSEGEIHVRVLLTWSSILREWSTSPSLRLSLIDGRLLRGRIESVGSDYVDVRDADGSGHVVMIAALRSAVISR
jgi:hypothetical protein